MDDYKPDFFGVTKAVYKVLKQENTELVNQLKEENVSFGVSVGDSKFILEVCETSLEQLHSMTMEAVKEILHAKSPEDLLSVVVTFGHLCRMQGYAIANSEREIMDKVEKDRPSPEELEND